MKNTWEELLRVRPFRSAVRNERFQTGDCPFRPRIVLIDLDAFPTVGESLAVVEDLRIAYPNTRIIVLMGDAMHLAQRAYDAGASACLPKPIDYAVVLKLLDLMVRSEAAQPAAETPVAAPRMSPRPVISPVSA